MVHSNLATFFICRNNNYKDIESFMLYNFSQISIYQPCENPHKVKLSALSNQLTVSLINIK